MLIKTEIREYANKLALLLECASFYKMNDAHIEKCILKSSLISKLEKSDRLFLYDSISNLFSEIFDEPYVYKEPSIINYWVALSYIHLFFKYKKSFSYIMTYLSYKDMKNYFSIYHTLDTSHLYDLFEKLETKNSLISLLVKKNKLTLSKLAVITEISYNTIDLYNRKNVNLYNASVTNIYKLAEALRVDYKIFIKELDLKFVSSVDTYLNVEVFDKVLLFVLSYYEPKVAKRSYKYDKSLRAFYAPNSTLLVREYDGKNSFDIFVREQVASDNHTSLLVLIKNIDIDLLTYIDNGFENIYLLSSSKLKILSNNTKPIVKNIDNSKVSINI